MLLKTYLKELKDCFRDRRTLLLTVLMPIVMMTGLVFFYEKMVSDDEGEMYKLAVNKSAGAEVSAMFEGLKNVELVKAADPEQALKDGKAQAVLILGNDFSGKIASGSKADATVIGDSFSQKSSNLMTIVNNVLAGFEKSVIAERLKEKGTDPLLIEPLKITQKEMSEENPNINLLAMLIPMVLAIAIGIGSSPAAADLFAGEKERKTMEALLMTPIKRSTLVLSKWLTIATVGSITGMMTLVVVSLEIRFFTENLKKAVSFGDNVYVIVALAVLVSIIYSMFTASLLMLMSIIGKTVKEAQSYSTPVLMLGMFPVMYLVSKGINELSFGHFATPILNLFCLLKELIFNVVSVEHVVITVISNLLCMAVLFAIGRLLFLKDKWVMN